LENVRRDLIITIDGPSGAGKSTVARMLADRLGYAYLDTGAMYRGVACAYMLKGGEGEMSLFLKNLVLTFEFGKQTKVFLDDKEISEEIRDPKVSLTASRLSQNRLVREYLTTKQREAGAPGGIVMEGRDTGSVVFPGAGIKFYLDADPVERGRRRFLELAAKGEDSNLDTVIVEMTKRDRDDSEREIAPLIVPEGAVRIDTTGMNVQEVVEKLETHILASGV
jgi:CMP/dCMP kinase